MTRARSCPWRTSDQPENSRQGSERYCEANLITSWSSGVCPQVIAPLTDEHTNPVHVPNGRFSTHAFSVRLVLSGSGSQRKVQESADSDIQTPKLDVSLRIDSFPFGTDPKDMNDW